MNKNSNQKNFKKGGQKKPQQRQERIVSTFSMKVNDVEELLDCIYRIPGAVKDMMDGYKLETLEDLNYAMADIFIRNIPDMTQKKNTFWALNLSMDKAFLKTGKYVGFGYSIDKSFDQASKSFKINSIEIRFVSYNAMRTVDEINYVREYGFEEVNK